MHMSKPRKKNRNDRPAAPAANRKRAAAAAGIVLGVAAIGGAVGFGWWRSTPPNTQPNPPLSQVASTTQPAAVSESKPEFQKLKGKWLRPDGGYVFEVKTVAGDGSIDASYLNPRPIHVARAEASQDGEAIRVFVELRDVNYPGSTYDLAYDPQSDQLKGIYYQAALQQRFEVFFVRLE
jgi:hypothetical protein